MPGPPAPVRNCNPTQLHSAELAAPQGKGRCVAFGSQLLATTLSGVPAGPKEQVTDVLNPLIQISYLTSPTKMASCY